MAFAQMGYHCGPVAVNVNNFNNRNRRLNVNANTRPSNEARMTPTYISGINVI